jgi:tetratricopeptide (TPR) repeat protein
MTDNHLLLYRLAELMFEHEQHMLPVDLLFDDTKIGDFAKSIQIDSPYQQMLLEGVLTESVREEKLFVSFTIEGYFHYVLGEVIYNRTEGLGAEALKHIVEENKLIGAKEGIEQCLIRDVEKEDFKRLFRLIDIGGPSLDLTITPFAASFSSVISIFKKREEIIIKKARFIIKKLYYNPSKNDDLVIFKCIEYLKSKYRSNEIYGIQASLDLIVQNDYSDENILVLLNIFPLIQDGNKKQHYVSYLERLLTSKGLTNRMKWEINSSLAYHFRQKSEYSNAKYYHGKVIKYELGFYGRISKEYAESLHFDGLIEVIYGRYDNARKLYRNELRIRKKITRDINNDVFITRCIHSIALTYQYQGNYATSIKHYELALKRRLIEGGRYCESTIGTMANLGCALAESGNSMGLAEKYLSDSIQINVNLKGQYSDNSTAVPMLARIKFDKGEISYAESLLLENLASREQMHGSSSRETAFSHADLMNFYTETESLVKALHHSQIQNEILVNVFGERHEFTISSYSELGECLYRLEKFDDAISRFEKALLLSKKYCFKNSEFIIELYYNLGISHLKMGRVKETKKFLNQYLRTKKNGTILNLMGLCWKDTNTRLSIKYHLMALDYYKQKLSINNIREIEILNSSENNSYNQIRMHYLSNIKMISIPSWLIKEYGL